MVSPWPCFGDDEIEAVEGYCGLERSISGQAAQLAGVSRVTFLLECRRYGAASVEWDQAEIAAEFADLDT